MITSKDLAEMFFRHKKPSSADLEGIVKKIESVQRMDPGKQGYLDRLQRGTSWLNKAMQMDSDQEARFIFLWIALNALCGVRQEVLKTDWWENEKHLQPSHTGNKTMTWTCVNWNGSCGTFALWILVRGF